MADSRPLLLEVEHLCKWFPLKRTAGDVLQRKEKRYLKAVNDVSFQLFKGENLGLVGESGCVYTRWCRPRSFPPGWSSSSP